MAEGLGVRVKGDVPGDGPPCKAVPAIALELETLLSAVSSGGKLLSPMAKDPALAVSVPSPCVLLRPWEPSQIPAWASGGER